MRRWLLKVAIIATLYTRLACAIVQALWDALRGK